MSVLSVDLLGYECVPEAALDNPDVWAAGKGVRLPQTCLTEIPERTPEALAEVIGREPTVQEFQTFSYRICTYFDDCGFGTFAVHVAIPPTPTIPVPAAGPMLALALIVVVLIRRWR